MPPQVDTADAVFRQLEEQNKVLSLNRLHFQLVCRELAQSNGSGNGIRRRVLQSLQRLSVRDGSNR